MCCESKNGGERTALLERPLFIAAHLPGRVVGSQVFVRTGCEIAPTTHRAADSTRWSDRFWTEELCNLRAGVMSFIQ